MEGLCFLQMSREVLTLSKYIHTGVDLEVLLVYTHACIELSRLGSI
jgi:hypothetical protein